MPELKASLQSQMNHLHQVLTESELRRWHRRFQATPNVINLSLGEPNAVVSSEVKQAVTQAIEHDASYYASTQGYEPLRRKISTYMTETFAAPVYTPDEVLVTVGATEGIYVALQTLFKRGDALLIPVPAYPLYKNIARFLGLDIVTLDTSDAGFKLTPDKLIETLQQHPNIKGLIFNDPTNPTGVVYSEDEIRAVAQTLGLTDILVVTDEIYGALTYEIKHVTLAKYLPEQTVIVGGLSKSHAMQGYRLGFVLGPQQVMQRLTQVHQLVVGSVPTPLMIGAMAGLDEVADVDKQRKQYAEQRDVLISGLTASGLQVIKPAGAFYVLVQVPVEWDEIPFVEALCSEAGVGVLPGQIFDIPGYIRISFAGAKEELHAALQRIHIFMNQ